MTVTTTKVQDSFVGDGVTADFAFTFPTLDAAWVKVLVAGVEVTATVTLNLNQTTSPGGTVTPLLVPIAGAEVVVLREVPLTQETLYSSYAAFPSAVHEAALDKMTMVDQQLAAGQADFDTALLAEEEARAAADLAEAALRASADAALTAAISQARTDFTAGAGGFADATPILAEGAIVSVPLNKQLGRSFTPEGFGAKGDGVTDDYAAFQLMIAAVNAAGGGRIEFKRKATYYIGQYAILGGAQANGVTELTFTNCDGLIIEGNGAKVDIKGNFNRSWDYTGAGPTFYHFSYRSSIGFQFYSCSNVAIRNLEVDGNVDQMTRDAAVAENGAHSYGLYFGGCSRVRLESVYSHHHATDGLGVTSTGPNDNYKVTRNFAAENCRFTNNARQGCSIGQARYLSFTDCEFSDQGVTGAYGGHSPQAGVDIEPTRYPGAPGGVMGDDFTGDIIFDACVFRDNGGAEYVGGSSAETACIHPVVFIACTFMSTATGGTPSGSRVSSGTKVTRFLGCHFLEDGVWPFYGGAAVDATTEVMGCTFDSSNPEARAFLAAGGVTGNLVVHYNRFRFTGTAPPGVTTYRIYVQNEDLTFEHNSVWIDGREHDGVTFDVKFLLQAVTRVAFNTWKSDLATAGCFFVVSYTTSPVRGDRYLSGGKFSPGTTSYAANEYSNEEYQYTVSATPGTLTPLVEAGRTMQAVLGASTPAALTIAAPTAAGGAALMPGKRLAIYLVRTSATAFTYAWNAIYKMPAFVGPANGFSKIVEFEWNGTNWVQLYASADIPN